MRFPWQGTEPHRASAPSAGVCHRCVTHLPGARVAERSDALGAVEIGRHRGMRLSCGRSRAAAARLAGTGASMEWTVTCAPGLSRFLCEHGHA
nr:MAG TPA: hypothetical protein [Caudoviricetes sp.]